MPKPTFDINELVAQVGRAFQNPFGYPTRQQQNPVTPKPIHFNDLRAIDIQSPKVQRQMLGEEPYP